MKIKDLPLTIHDRKSIESTKKVILGDYKGHIAENRKAVFESIKKEGIKNPIELNAHVINKGFCRIACAELLGIEEIEVEYVNRINATNTKVFA